MKSEKNKPKSTGYRETLERYCHVLDSNVPVSRYTEDGKTVYECSKWEFCEKNGGCQNKRYS